MEEKETIELEIEQVDGVEVEEFDIPEPNVKLERTKAIVTIVLTAAFNIANLYGYSVDAEAWINIVLTIVSFAFIVYAWWKNQNVTEPAARAQMFLDFLKAGDRMEIDEAEEDDAE